MQQRIRIFAPSAQKKTRRFSPGEIRSEIAGEKISEIMAPRFGLRERVVIKHRKKMLMDNQANLAFMAMTAISPDEKEASVQPKEAVGQLGEFFHSPPFPVE
jgi:hypothetical protein